MSIARVNPGRAEKVLAVGSPLGLIGSVAEGIVSAIRKEKNRVLIQTEAEINPGNSGGALVNLRGQLVGINVQKYVGIGIEGLNFSVSPETVREFIREGVEAGKLPGNLAGVL
jgi:serine protease Do